MKDDPFKIKEGSVRDSQLKDFSKSKHSGDYLDFIWSKAQGSLAKFFPDKKIIRFFLILLLALIILWGQSFYLQIIQGKHFRDIAEGNRIRQEVIKANRGLIYDRFGNLLAKNTSYFFLYMIPDELSKEEQPDLLLKEVSQALDLDTEELKERLVDGDQEKILVYEDLPYQQAIQLMLLSEKHSSLEVNYESRRQYFPYLGLSHVLGYLGVVTAEDFKTDNYQHYDRIGKTGLELAYEDILRGRDGIRQIEVDALNKEKNIIAFQESIDGSDLTLTLDAKAQSKLYSIMADNASRYGRYKMAGVVLDAHDGGVLAMVSLPIFDNNIFTSSLDQDVFSKIINDPATPLLNRAIAGKYPFGSIFKPVVAAAALEEDLIDGQFTVFSSGGVELGNSFFPDWRSGGHGLTDVKWALADSVNTFFYTIGGGNNQWLQQGLGMEKIINYANDFGLGQKTDIDLNTEEAGFLPSKRWKEETFDERWYVGDTYNLSIGQGYLLGTPIQAATLMSYFTNGEILQPHFIKETNNNNQIEQYQPKVVVKDIISEDNLNILRRGLRQAVEKGTAKSLLAVDVPVAAKTGTAQFNRNKTPHSWLTAFAPYQEPEIIVAILVEEGGDQGVAVTVAREFLQWYF